MMVPATGLEQSREGSSDSPFHDAVSHDGRAGRSGLRASAPSQADGRLLRMDGAQLTGTNLRGADLTGARLEAVRLDGADLTGACLRGARLGGAVLRGACLRGADLTGTDIGGLHAQAADLTGADLRRASTHGRGVCLDGAVIDGADLRGADMRDSRFARASLRGCDVSHTDFSGSDLRDADLSAVHVGWSTTWSSSWVRVLRFGTTVRLNDCDLAGVQMDGASLPGASAVGSTWTRARVRSSDLALADLSHADLRQVEIARTDLSRIRLIGADMRRSALVAVWAPECDLRGSAWVGATVSTSMLLGAAGATDAARQAMDPPTRSCLSGEVVELSEMPMVEIQAGPLASRRSEHLEQLAAHAHSGGGHA